MVKACVMDISRSIFDAVGFQFEKLAATYTRDSFATVKEAIASTEEGGEGEEIEETHDNLSHDEIKESIPLILLQVECLSLVLKLWLRRINLLQHSDKEQLNRLQDLEHVILTTQESVIKPYKNFLVSNQDKDLTDLLLEPMFHIYPEILEEKLTKLSIEKAKVNFEILEEDNVRMKRETVRVCSYLGLKLDFLDRLEDYSAKFRYHRTLFEWVVISLRKNYATLTLRDKNSLSKELLDRIGFDPLSSAADISLARPCTDTVQKHLVDPGEWAEIYIEDEFKYNILLSKNKGRFPFQSDKTNEWFELPISECKLYDGDPLCNVFAANLLTKENETLIMTTYMLRKFPEGKHTFLFHGTDHESALDILNGCGIHLSAGKEKRDFSSGKGFYLTDKIEDALKWAKSKTVRPAILVFRLNAHGGVSSNNKTRKLTLNAQEDLDKWRDIVSLFRSVKQTAKTRQIISEYDFIEGPVATVGSQTNGHLVFEPKPLSYQMCLISEDFAEQFRESLHSILFY
ncbi:uncharacterized protein LOC111337435 isoform X1 [Stylophora pistillata]|uniref:uncharacterized protein LOC111337435 isoform X1 n=1 Tax=Stylophora pistillata TaxID=50429 RepID=UPI000C039369|nr:uncharacterized protein LOC111337435 isoform X1 [Stylophora pistillata]